MTAPPPVPAETPGETPAALLRRAAAKVRELAKGATAGRWEYDRFKVGESWQVGVDNDAWTEGWQPIAEVFGDTSRANSDRGTAAWIAAMSPVVAEPLAAWLDIAAAESQSAFYGPNRPHPALALARVLLGEAS